MPRVSVVIPAYNHEKYVAEAIQSVLDQTYQDFEIIITDDASTDNTVAEIKKFKDPRIKLFRFEKNQGGAAAVNNCIKHAKGEYIANLSSDDVFLPNKLEKQVKFLDSHKEIGAVFGYAQIIDENGGEFTDKNHFYYNIFKQPNRTRLEWLNHFFYKGNCLCHPSMLIRKECYEKIGMYDPRYAQLPDFDMWIKLCMEYEIYVMPENLIKFRIRKGELNISGNRPETIARWSVELLEILKNFLQIKSQNDFSKIFPDIIKGAKTVDDNILSFYLYKIALDNEKLTALEYKYFAISGLFNLLNNKETAKKIGGECNFTHTDLIRISGQYKVFAPQNTWAQLFIDSGNGFTEKKSIIRTISGSETELVFDLNGYKSIKQVRFDPINDFVVMRIKNIAVIDKEGNRHNISNYQSNAYCQKNGVFVFATYDPQIFNIDLSKTHYPQKIIFRFEFLAKGTETLSYILEYNKEQILYKNAQIDEFLGLKQNLENEIKEKNANIAQKEKLAQELNKTIHERDKAIENLGTAIGERDKAIGNLNINIQKKDEGIEKLNKAIHERDKTIENLGIVIGERDKSINNLNGNIQKKDEGIEKLNKAIQEKDKTIDNLNATIHKGNGTINNLNEIIDQKTQELMELTRVIQIKNEESDSLNKIIYAGDQEISGLNRTIETKDINLGIIRNSWSYRIGRSITRPLGPIYKVLRKSK